MEILKFAAVDIGSNAVRLLLVNVIESGQEPSFKKAMLVRLPVRLGEDTFGRGKISQYNQKRLTNAMQAFRYLMLVNEVLDYRACATSAMREAENGAEVISVLKGETGIHIDLIEGDKEAEIIFSTQMAEAINPDNNYLYIDIGGGSTELTVFSNGKKRQSNSFQLGTIRDLAGPLQLKESALMEQWLKDAAEKYGPLSAIGSGGNINKLAKMSGKGKQEPISYQWIKQMRDVLSSYSYQERVQNLDLNPDRADVIMPAMELVLSIMNWSGIKDIFAPKFGLADGIIRELYREYKIKNNQ